MDERITYHQRRFHKCVVYDGSDHYLLLLCAMVIFSGPGFVIVISSSISTTSIQMIHRRELGCQVWSINVLNILVQGGFEVESCFSVSKSNANPCPAIGFRILSRYDTVSSASQTSLTMIIIPSVWLHNISNCRWHHQQNLWRSLQA